MAAVLGQAGPDCYESVAAEKKTEDAGGPCLFWLTRSGALGQHFLATTLNEEF
jgi:hypothetical protein